MSVEQPCFASIVGDLIKIGAKVVLIYSPLFISPLTKSALDEVGVV